MKKIKKITALMLVTAIAISGFITRDVDAYTINRYTPISPKVCTIENGHAFNADEANTHEYKMWRMYNSSTGEHFYTSSNVEMCDCMDYGWTFEGIGWVAPDAGNKPVYRLYHNGAGLHHYTMEENERDTLVAQYGWTYEGIGWYSSEEEGSVPLYREYNPNSGQHNYTTSVNEHTTLTQQGWIDEGIAWYSNADTFSEIQEFNEKYPLDHRTNFTLTNVPIYLGNLAYKDRSYEGDEYYSSISSCYVVYHVYGKDEYGGYGPGWKWAEGIGYYSDDEYLGNGIGGGDISLGKPWEATYLHIAKESYHCKTDCWGSHRDVGFSDTMIQTGFIYNNQFGDNFDYRMECMPTDPSRWN